MIIETLGTGVKMMVGFICTAITVLFGGMDAMLWSLIILITLDYATGILAAVATKSLSSEISFKGLLKKVTILIVIAVAHQAGRAVGIQEIRSFVVGFYLANEGISILENAAKVGVPMPEKLLDVLEQLKE